MENLKLLLPALLDAVMVARALGSEILDADALMREVPLPLCRLPSCLVGRQTRESLTAARAALHTHVVFDARELP